MISSFTLVYHKWQSYNKWFPRYEARQTEFWGILGIFCPFNPLTIPKIKILKKWKKMLRDIIILHKCTKNDDHMLYSSWDTDSRRIWFLFFILGCFLPFNNPNIFTSAPKIMIKWYKVSEIWCANDGRTDGRTDGRKRWHIEVGAQPKNGKNVMRRF